MKANLRIKLLQEATKAKNIRLVAKDISKSEAYKLRRDRNRLDDKIKFYKNLSKELEKSDKNDNL